jgi:lipopolysaccharide export system permease protein
MKTLKTYIVCAFFVTLMATIAVFTFIISISSLFKMTDLLAKGIPLKPLLDALASGIPSALGFAIPISAMIATLLVFGRLSADSEITAMRACGISLWQITGWMMPIALLLVLLCVYIHSEWIPYSHYVSRTVMSQLAVINPVDLIEEGRTIREFEGLSLYVEKKKGNTLEHVRIFDHREKGHTREIKAESGVVLIPTNSSDIVLSLEQVTVDPFSFDRPGKADAAKWSLRIADARRHGGYRRRDKDLTLAELLMGAKELRMKAEEFRKNAKAMDAEAAALNATRTGTTPVATVVDGFMKNGLDEQVQELRSRAMKMMVEFHKRLALSGACFSFIFLGIPLGIRSHRKESSIGIAMSLVMVFLFYLFIILAQQMGSHPELRPDLVNWIPIVVSVVLGFFMIRN